MPALVILVWAVLATVLGAPAASAHAELQETWPADGSTPRAAVDRVRLTFTGPVLADLTEAVVEDVRGDTTSVVPEVDGAVVTIPLRPSRRAGDYRLDYRTVAADGHPLVGEVTFTVSPAGARAAREGRLDPAASPEAVTPRVEPAKGARVSPDRVTGLVLGGALVAVLALAMVRRSAAQERGTP